ncbi:hypothetical protein PMIN03_003911 [Paraphaeosphaeria minitans]|uniref:Uncharacterized protein n=1 Tax=Paraphaeosphaeria minitans TaxID=565426 RepID=A0A9P6G753_9PLEO|nr:hypothetical protein PMIN01_11206 [Paraphaeosphaeria minitans]
MFTTKMLMPSLYCRLLTVIFVLVGWIALMLVYMVCWQPEIFHVDRDPHWTLNSTTLKTTSAVAPNMTPSWPQESDFMRQVGTDYVATHRPTASTLHTVVAPTLTGQASTTEASHMAEPTPHEFFGHEKRDSKARHTRRGFYTLVTNWVKLHFSLPGRGCYGCSGKPYTRDLQFALKHPNGTFFGSGNFRSTPVFYIWTRWALTYPDVLLKAVLDDPTEFADCPNGHCISRAISGTDGLRLYQIINTGEDDLWCYDTIQAGVSRLGVQLGKTSRMHGDHMPVKLNTSPYTRNYSWRRR